MSRLPVLRSSFDMYLEEISRFPLLTPDEEYRLAKRYTETGSVRAAQKLVTANLRFVVKIAHEYRRYDVKLSDLVQEGNIGLMKAVSKFNPDRGFRLITYAVWWIRAYMQNYIIKNWSVVKLRSGGRNRTLFFRSPPDDETDTSRMLPSESSRTQEDRELHRETRLALRDFSLDAMMDKDGTRTFLDMLPSAEASQEDVVARKEEHQIIDDKLKEILPKLNPKERHLLKHRVLSEEPETLQQIGDRFSISRERVRQIEVALKRKIKKSFKRRKTRPRR